MKIYLISPVREVSEETDIFVDAYVAKLEELGHEVHYPKRDVEQNDKHGISICFKHARAMIECDCVHIIWDKTSFGSHFDLGMAFILKKPLHLVTTLMDDYSEKSFEKVIKYIEKEGYNYDLFTS